MPWPNCPEADVVVITSMFPSMFTSSEIGASSGPAATAPNMVDVGVGVGVGVGAGAGGGFGVLAPPSDPPPPQADSRTKAEIAPSLMLRTKTAV